MESQQEEVHSAERKVRFDLNHEVFLIPSKWERLSRGVSKKDAGGPNLKNKPRTQTSQTGRDGRKKGKQKREAGSKKNNNPSPSADAFSRKYGKTSRTSTPSKNIEEGKKVAPFAAKESTASAGATGRVDSKFKLSHRTAKELPRVDIVLPKISYTHDLKKAIEVAIRSNRLHAEESRTKEFAEALERPRSLSEGSGSDLGSQSDDLQIPGEGRFSELSRRGDGWNPFPAWREASMNHVLRERGKVLSSLIPNSILYWAKFSIPRTGAQYRFYEEKLEDISPASMAYIQVIDLSTLCFQKYVSTI